MNVLVCSPIDERGFCFAIHDSIEYDNRGEKEQNKFK